MKPVYLAKFIRGHEDIKSF